MARKTLIEKGDMESPQHGMWRITDSGRARVGGDMHPSIKKDIRDKAVPIVVVSSEGIKYYDLVRQLQEIGNWNFNTIESAIWDLDKRFPDKISKPSRGLFVPISEKERKSPNRTEEKMPKRREYGEPINFRGLRHAPINELGVVYLFGMLSHELGFYVESIASAFPDCVAKRPSDKPGRYIDVQIEFEYKSSSFVVHGHEIENCDVIVCWENDWKDCPIEVISLKEYLKTHESR